MKKILFIITLLCLNFTLVYSQGGFVFQGEETKDKISFELINNLVVLPVEIHGKKRFFILDTGVNSTILFGLSPEDSLLLKNTSTIKLRGLGGGESIEAIKSTNNVLSVGKAKDANHTFYVIYDETFNLSKKMGIPIHGILGYEFFKNFVVKFNYNSNKMTFYEPASFAYKKCKKCSEFDLSFYKNKAYITLEVLSKLQVTKQVKLLIDSGSSDALWLFDEKDFLTENPKNYFDDYLGQGLNGNIFGKRSKIAEVTIGAFKLKDVKVAFPESENFENVHILEGRNGSIGNELLKRFTVILDYQSNKITLKKNSNFKNHFYYNMSGLTIEHEGVEVIKEKYNKINRSAQDDTSSMTNGSVSILVKEVFDFYLVPKFVITDVREGSPAGLVGIKKGDEVISINGKGTYNYKLSDLIAMFSSKENRHITLVISRDGVVSKKKFTLKKVI